MGSKVGYDVFEFNGSLKKVYHLVLLLLISAAFLNLPTPP